MHAHVRSASGRAMPALLASVRNHNPSGRDAVRFREYRPVWTTITAKALIAQKIDDQKTTNGKRKKSNPKAGKGVPKTLGR